MKIRYWEIDFMIISPLRNADARLILIWPNLFFWWVVGGGGFKDVTFPLFLNLRNRTHSLHDL